MAPQVSVCIPSYQGGEMLAATLRSVLASDHPDFEVVVRDNGSTDGTDRVVAAFDDPRIRYVRAEETVPLAENWQLVLDEARGDYVKVVCADDLIHPRSLSSQAAVLADPTIALVASRRDFIDGTGATLAAATGLHELLGRQTATDVARAIVSFGINPIGESASVMFRRADAAAVGGWDGTSVYPMDIDLWLRLLSRGDMLGQPESLAAFRVWTDSLSSRHNQAQFRENLRFIERVAETPAYGIEPRAQRRLTLAARLSWWAWAARQWTWTHLPPRSRDGYAWR